MPGRGAPPKPQSRTRHKPIRGAWQATPGVGWQHGTPPQPPDGLLEPSRVAWTTWMAAWFASHWTPADLPGLRKVIQLYDATERGELHRSSELRMSMDTYGITPKGQQDRRWSAPKADEPAATPTADAGSRYANLKVV